MLELLLLGLPVTSDEWVVPPPVYDEIQLPSESISDPCGLVGSLGLDDDVRCIPSHEVLAPSSLGATLETGFFRLRLWDTGEGTNRVDGYYSADYTAATELSHFRGYFVPVCESDGGLLALNGPGQPIFNSSSFGILAVEGGASVSGYGSLRVSGACPVGHDRRLLALGTWNDVRTQQSIWFEGDGYRAVDGWTDFTSTYQLPSGNRFIFEVVSGPAVGETGQLTFRITATGLAEALEPCGTNVSCRNSELWDWTGFDGADQASGLSFQRQGGTTSITTPGRWNGGSSAGCTPIVDDVTIECVTGTVTDHPDEYGLRFPSQAFAQGYRPALVYYPEGATDRPVFDGRQLVQATLTDWGALTDVEWLPEQRTETIWESTGLCESVSDCFDQCTIGNPITDFGGFLSGIRCWLVPDFDPLEIFTGLGESFQGTVGWQVAKFNWDSVAQSGEHLLAQERACGTLVELDLDGGVGSVTGQIAAVGTCGQSAVQVVDAARILITVVASIGAFFGIMGILGWMFDTQWPWDKGQDGKSL